MLTTLTDGGVTVRTVRLADVDPVYDAAIESVAEIHPWMDWCHADMQRSETAKYVETALEAWKAGEQHPMVIAATDDGRILGSIGMNRLDPIQRSANLGYWVRTSAAGRGIATTATRLLATWGLTKTDLVRIEIRMAVGNIASQRVAEKAGAVREGVDRDGLFFHGRAADAVRFSLIRDDLPLQPQP